MDSISGRGPNWAVVVIFMMAGPAIGKENQYVDSLFRADVKQQTLELNEPLATTGTGLRISLDDSWELEDSANVSNTLYDTANCIYSHLRNNPDFRIVVGYDRELGPISLYRIDDEKFDKVLLSNTPIEYRPQIMYQFSHEFCHVISDYNRIRSTESKNEWFHEALCELASIFVLYSTNEPSLKKYIDDYLQDSRDLLSNIQDFRSWLLDKEDGLRTQVSGGLDRMTNAVVAYRLYPLFKQYPTLWNALWHLPNSDSTLESYMSEWNQAVDEQDRHLLDKLAELLLGEHEQL